MVKQAQIARGEKWTIARASAVFEKRDVDVKWIDDNVVIQEDIKAYNSTLSAKIETKSVGKK